MIMAKKRKTIHKAKHAKAKARKAPAKAKAKPKKAVAKRKPAKTRMAAPKVSGRFNMIITFDPNHAGTAEAELKAALGKIGEKAAIARTEVEGLIKAKVSDAR